MNLRPYILQGYNIKVLSDCSQSTPLLPPGAGHAWGSCDGSVVFEGCNDVEFFHTPHELWCHGLGDGVGGGEGYSPGLDRNHCAPDPSLIVLVAPPEVCLDDLVPDKPVRMLDR